MSGVRLGNWCRAGREIWTSDLAKLLYREIGVLDIGEGGGGDI